jgi:hypothetical protein
MFYKEQSFTLNQLKKWRDAAQCATFAVAPSWVHVPFERLEIRLVDSPSTIRSISKAPPDIVSSLHYVC